MSDRDTRTAGPSTGYPTAPVPAPKGSLVGQPPPYSACLPHSPTINSNYPDRRSPLPKNTSETSPLYGVQQPGAASNVILHDTASSAPFLTVPPESENDDDGHIPIADPDNRQPAYNPDYTANRQNNPRTNVYGRKTVVLQRDKNSRRKGYGLFAFAMVLIIGAIIATIVVACLFPGRSRRVKNYKIERADPPKDFSFDDFDRRFEDKSDDLFWKARNSVTAANPFLDDKYKDIFNEEPRKEKSDDKVFREMGIIVPDYDDKYKDILNGNIFQDKISNDPVIKPIEMSDDMKELLGMARGKKKDNERIL